MTLMTSGRRGRFRLLVAPLAFLVTGLNGCPPEVVAARPQTLMEQAPFEVALAVQAAFPAEVWEDALAVARCESNWAFTDPKVTSPRRANAGVFQINKVHRKRVAALGYTWDQVRTDPMVNALVAADIWREQGWRPWTCKKAIPRSRW
jgi:hypothetical protein